MEWEKSLKSLLIVLLFFTSSKCLFAQHDFSTLIKNGKNEFSMGNYAIAAALFEEAIIKNPKHAEAHYFLGYCYSRLNSDDGKDWLKMTLPLLLKTSNEFETVNHLSPKYQGEVVVLDPYSKISAEWASMAIKYLYYNKPDSALWALKEGNKRGGFGELFLAQARLRLDQCSKNAILFTFGDNATFPLWYVQTAEGFRKDVAIVDLSMLNTVWYPEYLSRNNILDFGITGPTLDSIEYMEWTDSLITIGDFSWTVQPSYNEAYILRGDRLMLNLLKQNNFKREIYFTTANDVSYQLGLDKYFLSLLEIDKLNVKKETPPEFTTYKNLAIKILTELKKANKNSQQELNTLDNIRFGIMKYMVYSCNKMEAQELLKLIDLYSAEKEYPYQSKEGKTYADAVREYVNE